MKEEAHVPFVFAEVSRGVNVYLIRMVKLGSGKKRWR